MHAMRVVGIDPGIRTIGVGIVEKDAKGTLHARDWLTVQTQGTDASLRLQEIHEDLSALLEEHRPTLAVVERVFFAVNEKSAIEVAQARGVILLTLAEHGIPVLEPSPLQIKAAITGDGKADKRQMQDMVARTLEMKEIPTPVDAADALAMAIYGTLVERFEVSVESSKTQA